ncbi:MAG: hypothetical protein HUK02_00845 [Bacteroidaceae bacterium]|nr:hypothetical protein [Bacteroidaceae bacterium]
MKKVINGVLLVCAAAMLFICYRSIAGQQEFDDAVKAREKAVKARLVEIRDAEEAYKLRHGEYCDNFDSLIAFVKTGTIPVVIKAGELTEAQLEKGLTESKAAAIVARGNAAEIAANGLVGFSRDTSWVSIIDSLFLSKNPEFDPEALRYIPGSDEGDVKEKQQFELLAVMIKTKSEAIIPVMECGATYSQYMVGDSKLWKRECANKTELANSQGAYDGLKIGDASLNWNNNAGNWE